MTKNLAVVVSDLHMGTGERTCWYQPSIHEPYLTRTLEWVAAHAGSVRELVLLGDVFDLWSYPPDVTPPSLADVVDANPAVLGRGGLLGQVVSALDGAVSFVPGSHDDSLSPADLATLGQAVGTIRPHGRVVTLTGRTGRRTSLAHGHAWTMFNAPDPASRWGTLPIGHFVTRSFAYYLSMTLKPDQTVADLANQGAPNGFDLTAFLGALSLPFTPSLTDMLLNYVSRSAGLDPDLPIRMAGGGVTTIDEAKEVYRDLFTRWAEDTGGPWSATRSAMAGQWGEHLAWFAQRLAFETNSDLVVLGHTHVPVAGLSPSPVNYLNSGFGCPYRAGPATREPTFVVVDLDTATGVVVEARDPAEGEAIEPRAAATVPPVVSPGMDFSCYATVENESGTNLVLDTAGDLSGTWVVPPPARIPAGSRARFWVQDDVGLRGSAATVTYRHGSESVTFRFGCPTGTTPNTVSTTVKEYATKAGSGPWVHGGTATLGHPLQARFTVRGARSATFSTDSCGRTSGRLDPVSEPLRPGDTLVVGGSADLSGCIIGNKDARVYSIVLQPHEGVFGHVIDVVAQGPRGAFSGYLNLWFTDETGATYRLGIFESTKKKHTVAYDSDRPAIVRVNWGD